MSFILLVMVIYTDQAICAAKDTKGFSMEQAFLGFFFHCAAATLKIFRCHYTIDTKPLR